MRIIAFCGPKHSGKDTAAKCLFKHNEGFGKMLFRHAPMADGIKAVAEDFFGWTKEEMADMAFKETPREYWPGGPVEPPRQFLMDGANWLRDRFGGAIHANRWARHCALPVNDVWGAHVTTDMRFPEEVDIFERVAGIAFLPIYVERKEAEQDLQWKKMNNDKMATDPSESHYDFLRVYCREYGVVIQNNTTIQDLHGQVNNAVKLKFTHWQYWEQIIRNGGTH